MARNANAFRTMPFCRSAGAEAHPYLPHPEALLRTKAVPDFKIQKLRTVSGCIGTRPEDQSMAGRIQRTGGSSHVVFCEVCLCRLQAAAGVTLHTKLLNPLQVWEFDGQGQFRKGRYHPGNVYCTFSGVHPARPGGKTIKGSLISLKTGSPSGPAGPSHRWIKRKYFGSVLPSSEAVTPARPA